MFKHFIVTPFNVDLGLKSRDEFLDKDYLSQRFQVFQDLCFPTVYQQTNQNFYWLVFFDQETPDEFKQLIEKYQKWINFVAIFTTSNLDFQPFLVKVIQSYLTDETTHIITTWLDGDDAIANHFIETVQQQFNHQDFEYVNFPYGYQLERTGLYLRQYLSSQFISLIEKVEENLLTCKVMSHHDLYTLYHKGLPVRQVLTDPMWIQLIHENNMYTTLDFTSIPQPYRRLTRHFTVQEFVKSYVNDSYLSRIYRYLNHLVNQLFRLSTRQIIRHLIALIYPRSLHFFLHKSLKVKHLALGNSSLSLAETKALCLRQKTIWRKPLN